MSLVLIGFSRCGKTFLGSQLSQQLGRPFIDTDLLLEEKTGKEVSVLYSEVGELRFRMLEKQILHSISIEQGTILATGGGLPCYEENGSYLRTLGKVVFLDLPKGPLWKALCKDRLPSFLDRRHPVTSFEAHYEKRYPLYSRCSTHRIELSEPGERAVLDKLRAIFESQQEAHSTFSLQT